MTTATETHHPATKTYWIVGAVLAAVTAVEIAVSYIDFFGSFQAPILIALGLVKFVTVVAVFMHLRYDLRGYRTLFLFGLIGALLVFTVVMAAMQAF